MATPRLADGTSAQRALLRISENAHSSFEAAVHLAVADLNRLGRSENKEWTLTGAIGDGQPLSAQVDVSSHSHPVLSNQGHDYFDKFLNQEERDIFERYGLTIAYGYATPQGSYAHVRQEQT
jgi:hypothetical protein